MNTGRHTLNFQQAGYGGAAQEQEQAARDEVHVAVAWASERTCLERKCWQYRVPSNNVEQSWACHQVILLDEMGSVAGDALEIHRRNLLSEANAEFQRHQRQSQGHLQEYQHDVQRHLTDIQNNALSQQVASGEAVEHFETRIESLSR